MTGRWIYATCACFGVAIILGSSSPHDPDPTFVVEPISVNASLSNEDVEFTCACIYCTGQFWVVDEEWALNDVNQGRGINVDDVKILTDGSFFYRLTMPPMQVNNNTEIYCVIHNTTSNKVNASQLVVLRVQGLLGEVEDLAVETINSTTLLVSFNEPFSLLGVPILFYTIAAIPIDTMDIISSTNSTETSVHISLYNVCSKHELIVSGWNEVGEGQIAKALAVLYDVPAPLNVDLITNDLQYQESKLEISLQFEINESCTGRIPDSVMLNISSIESNKLITTELCPLPKPLQDTQNCLFSVAIPETGATITPLVHVSLSQILQTNHHYHVSVFLGNQAGKVSSTGHVPIKHYRTINVFFGSTDTIQGTYDVQRGDVYISAVGSVCVTCTLLPGSPVKTCLAVFLDIATEERIEVVIPAPTFTDCVELPPGEYSVELRDVSVSGEVEMGVAYHIETTIKVNQTSPPSAASPSATATGNTQSTSFPIFPVALGATGLVIGLLVVVMIMLVVCLHHSKIKARSLAKEKEVETTSHHSPTAHLHDGTGEFGNTASEPRHIYDDLNELGIHRNPAIFLMPPTAICMQHCPAYAQPPPITTRPTRRTTDTITIV